MVTMTRDLERGLIAAGVPEEQAREIVDGLEARLADLATREDLERELTVFRREMELRFETIDYRFQGVDARFDAINQRFDDVNKRFDDIHLALEDLRRTMWRIIMILVTIGVAGGGALFGALMYSIFG